jgi:hypothetical protein
MQFKVPQFLDIEDKIFGPFTFKQFVYLAGGGGLCFIVYKLMGLIFGLIPMLAIAAFALALAFYRPNNKPLLNMVEAGFKFYVQNRLYVWKRRIQKPAQKTAESQKTEPTQNTYNSKNITGSRIKDLAWSLDVLDLNKNNQQKEGESK